MSLISPAYYERLYQMAKFKDGKISFEEPKPECDHKDCGRYETEGARYSEEDSKGAMHWYQVWFIHCSCCDKIIGTYKQEV